MDGRGGGQGVRLAREGREHLRPAPRPRALLAQVAALPSPKIVLATSADLTFAQGSFRPSWLSRTPPTDAPLARYPGGLSRHHPHPQTVLVDVPDACLEGRPAGGRAQSGKAAAKAGEAEAARRRRRRRRRRSLRRRRCGGSRRRPGRRRRWREPSTPLLGARDVTVAMDVDGGASAADEHLSLSNRIGPRQRRRGAAAASPPPAGWEGGWAWERGAGRGGSARRPSGRRCFFHIRRPSRSATSGERQSRRRRSSA